MSLSEPTRQIIAYVECVSGRDVSTTIGEPVELVESHEGGAALGSSISTTSLNCLRVIQASCEPSRDQSNVST